MPVEDSLVTARELLRMADDGLRHELVRGRLISMSPPGSIHGLCATRLTLALATHVERRRLGVVLQETGFTLSRDPDTVRAPDLAFVASAHLPPEIPRGYGNGAPDLAVEIVSPANRAREVRRKVGEYLASGAKEVWVVRPGTRIVEVHRARTGATSLGEADVLAAPALLPGFRYPLRRPFESL